MPAVAELHLWMNGVPVGVWSALRGGTPVLRYHPSWAAAEEGRALSLSLPITAGLEHRGDTVRHYFENLLPDSADIRRRLRRRFHTQSTEAFDLLAAIGRDCVGALQLLPPDAGPEGWNRIEAEKMNEVEVERALLAAVSDGPFEDGESDDLRISIAGAQEKTALLRMAGKWHRPRGATPTTHILKLPPGRVGNMRADMSDSVENEWLCAQLMAGLGIPMATTEMARFGETKALVVTRFDRRWQGIEPDAERKARFKPPAGAWIARLPQEDFCQALGVAPDRKYQSEGGPAMRDCLQLLTAAEHVEDDRATFALAQLAFWLLAATDGHAKNFSLHHRRGAHFGLTPLYDVLSAWPIIGAGPHLLPYERAKLAMGLYSTNMHYRLRDMQPRHWKHLADSCGASVWPRMLQMVEGAEDVLDALEQQLPPEFPPRTWRPIAAGLRRHAAQFLRSAHTPSG